DPGRAKPRRRRRLSEREKQELFHGLVKLFIGAGSVVAALLCGVVYFALHLSRPPAPAQPRPARGLRSEAPAAPRPDRLFAMAGRSEHAAEPEAEGPPEWQHQTIVLIAMLGVIAALLHHYAETRAFKAHVKQYQRMKELYERAR